MKYNTYDVINGGPRLVEIVKQEREKRYISGKKKEAFNHISFYLFIFSFLEIYKKTPMVQFFFFLLCSVDTM